MPCFPNILKHNSGRFACECFCYRSIVQQCKYAGKLQARWFSQPSEVEGPGTYRVGATTRVALTPGRKETVMDEATGKSEVARFRQQQALEEEAARLALYGYAEVARHDRIIARMERGGQRILRLIEEGKHKEALALMNTEHWGEEAEMTKNGKKMKHE
jgi:hypothetical protein